MSFPLAKGLSLVSRGARHQVRTVPYCTLAGDARWAQIAPSSPSMHDSAPASICRGRRPRLQRNQPRRGRCGPIRIYMTGAGSTLKS